MITVNMLEAKTRLSELVKCAEQSGETVLICRDGEPVAELKALPKTRVNRLKPDPRLKPLAIRYDPTEPLSAEEWPTEAS